MRRYRVGDVALALERAGYTVSEERSDYHLAYVRQGGDFVILPVPDENGYHSANELDQLFADRWIPIPPGSIPAVDQASKSDLKR